MLKLMRLNCILAALLLFVFCAVATKAQTGTSNITAP